MNVNAVFDTNIIIDLLDRKILKTKDLLSQYNSITISSISYVEVLRGAKCLNLQESYKKFLLSNFSIENVNTKISDISVFLSSSYKLKLVDSIVYATAKSCEAVLLTRDNDFPKEKDVVIPYTL